MKKLIETSCLFAVACSLPLFANAQMAPTGSMSATPVKSKVSVKVSGYCTGSAVLTASSGYILLMGDGTNPFAASTISLAAKTAADKDASVASMQNTGASLQISKGKLKASASSTGIYALMVQETIDDDELGDDSYISIPSYLSNVTCKNGDSFSSVIMASSSGMAASFAVPSGQSKLTLSGNSEALKYNFVAKSKMTLSYQQCSVSGTFTPDLAGIASDTFRSSCKAMPLTISYSASSTGSAAAMLTPAKLIE